MTHNNLKNQKLKKFTSVTFGSVGEGRVFGQ